MKKIKKITAAVLAAVLSTIVVFSGCSNDSRSESSVYSKSNPSSSQSASAESSKQESSKQESSKQEASKSTQADPDYTPAMWKVVKADKIMYLFGSIHATDDGAENLPDYVMNAFNECDSLAVEIDINSMMNDFSSIYNMMSSIVYSDGTTIKDHISEETYNSAVKLLSENNMYMSYYDKFKPMMWISLLENIIYSQASIDVNNSMETIMLKKAKDADKEVLEVESMEIQILAFDAISDDLADYMIKSYTEDGAAEELKKSMEELYDAWKKGEDLGSDSDSDSDGIPKELVDDYEAYNKAMLTDRNIGMADKAEQYMNDGKKTFFMVGAAHMYDDDGIVSILKERGYKVERVSSVSDSHNTAAETTSKAA